MAGLGPTRVFDRISDIDLRADLLDRGLTCALLDIDNTIRSRVDGQVPPDVRSWMAHVRRAGVSLCLLSNNFHSNVPRLAAELDIPYVYRAVKPLPFGYNRALQLMGVPRSAAVMVGDRLGTDILGARLLGMQAYLVAPLAGQAVRTAAFEQVFGAARTEPRGALGAESEQGSAFTRTDRAADE